MFNGLLGQQEVPATQTWAITVDDAGRLRSRVELGSSSSRSTWIVGDTLAHRWMAWHHQLYVLAGDASASDHPEDSALRFMENLVRQSRAETERLIGTVFERKGINFRLLEENPERPVAVIEIDGRTQHVVCNRVDDTLVVASLLYADDLHSYRWTYSGHRRVGERWVPETAEFVQRDVCGRISRSRYTNIGLSEEDGDEVTLFLRDVPDAQTPGLEHLVMATIFSRDGLNQEEFSRFDPDCLGGVGRP